MWPGADTEVEAFVFRHPESEANVTNTNLGNAAMLSPKGELQIEPMFERIDQLRVGAIICSEAERALHPVRTTAHKHTLPVVQDALFNEFRRPSWTVGKSNEDPEVAEALRRRIREFGPEYKPEGDGESFIEAWVRIELGLNFIRTTAHNFGTKRVAVIEHGLLARMQKSLIYSRGDFERFGYFFQALYEVEGFANAGMMHIWYGFPFRNTSEKCWNIEGADTSHLPEDLR